MKSTVFVLAGNLHCHFDHTQPDCILIHEEKVMSFKGQKYFSEEKSLV